MRRRQDVARAGDLDRFLSWLTGRCTQRDLDGGTGRTFRDRHAWCWNVAPEIVITGEIYDEIQVDGTYLGGGWCLLLAVNGATGEVIAWQWCDTEKTAAWTALLQRIPPPRVVVIDGGSGLASALKACWPKTKIQRCLVHVQRNVRTYLTMRPRTDAGKALRALSLALTRITTGEEAAAWQSKLHAWHQVYAPLINAKTYLKQAGVRPAWARDNAAWWWTHERLRKAYRLLERLVRQGALFTYLDPALTDLAISSTTNRIEGGANSPIKNLLRLHRGMTSAHQRRSVAASNGGATYTHPLPRRRATSSSPPTTPQRQSPRPGQPSRSAPPSTTQLPAPTKASGPAKAGPDARGDAGDTP